MKNLSLLLEGTNLQADWIVKSFPVIRIVLVVIMFICCIVSIVSVLMQENSQAGGTNAISGVQESYYASNKGESREEKLKRLTIIMISTIGVCILLYFISLLINNPVIS